MCCPGSSYSDRDLMGFQPILPTTICCNDALNTPRSLAPIYQFGISLSTRTFSSIPFSIVSSSAICCSSVSIYCWSSIPCTCVPVIGDHSGSCGRSCCCCMSSCCCGICSSSCCMVTGVMLTVSMSTGVVDSVILTGVDPDACGCTPRNICVMWFSVSLSSAYCSDINLICCCHLCFTPEPR